MVMVRKFRCIWHRQKIPLRQLGGELKQPMLAVFERLSWVFEEIHKSIKGHIPAPTLVAGAQGQGASVVLQISALGSFRDMPRTCHPGATLLRHSRVTAERPQCQM